MVWNRTVSNNRSTRFDSMVYPELWFEIPPARGGRFRLEGRGLVPTLSSEVRQDGSVVFVVNMCELCLLR